MANETYYTADEVCDLLKISRPTLSRLCRDRKIGFSRIGARLIRFTEQHLNDYRNFANRPAKTRKAQV